jgi:hypothetical protein
MPSLKMLLATFMKTSWTQFPWTWLIRLEEPGRQQSAKGSDQQQQDMYVNGTVWFCRVNLAPNAE